MMVMVGAIKVASAGERKSQLEYNSANDQYLYLNYAKGIKNLFSAFKIFKKVNYHNKNKGWNLKDITSPDIWKQNK